jgi:hypothetical protein
VRLVVQDHSRQIVREISSPKISRATVDWSCGSSGRVPVLQMRSPEFKIPYLITLEKIIEILFKTTCLNGTSIGLRALLISS